MVVVMPKIKIVQIAVAASGDDTWDTLAVDSFGRLWRLTNNDEFKQVELPEEPQL